MSQSLGKERVNKGQIEAVPLGVNATTENYTVKLDGESLSQPY